MRTYVVPGSLAVMALFLLAGAREPQSVTVKGELARLATKAEEDFTKRAQGTFYDSGYRAYCRLNMGFDEGLFKDIGFLPDKAVIKGYEFCYNVTDDLKKVALGATSSKDGKVLCLVIDATSGALKRGDIVEKDPCVP